MKKYTLRESILKDIDAAHRKIAKAKTVAQEHLDTEELLNGTGQVKELREAREAADKQFRKIKRLETVRLRQLGEKLAEFDTIPLIAVEASPTPEETMRAHQYRYYVLCDPCWSDREYDQFCKQNNLAGNGGSDSEADYSEKIKLLAEKLKPSHTLPETTSEVSSTPSAPSAA